MSHLSRPPRGQQRDKPYREALRMELAAAGEDMKKTARDRKSAYRALRSGRHASHQGIG